MKNAGESTGISVHSLACRRGGRVLFSDLEWRAGAGMLVAVRGPNGIGKTSLLRLLAGLALPEAGEVRWDDVPIGSDRLEYGAHLAWVGHADGLKGELTPRENLEFHQALFNVGAALRPRMDGIEQALDEMGLADFADTPCRQLSAGQRRRAALARLRIVAARLWILDEPLASLDVDGQQTVERIIGDHCGDGGIAVVTSHQPFAEIEPALTVALE